MSKKIYRRIAAGKSGTKKMLEKYGEDLVCVRYKYDAEKNIKYKTIELIVDQGIWTPGIRIRNNKIVGLRIQYGETDIRRDIKACGGTWDREKKLWLVTYGKVKELGLTGRIAWYGR